MQNFKNHTRYVPLYHFVLLILLLFATIGSSINLFKRSNAEERLSNELVIFVISIILLLCYYLMRSFPLKAQDRAIRAEENLRHYVLAGKLLDNRLTMSQIIALRFASDDEFVELAKDAAEKNMKSNDIKKAIKNWREDNYRV